MAIVNLWGTPTATLADDNQAAEQGINLGTVFKPTVSGAITHLRFYETANCQGTVDLKLYNSAGTVLASTTYSATNGASGWRDVALASSYTVTSGTWYMVMYHVPIRSTSNNTYATFSPNLSAARSSSGGELVTAADGAQSFGGNTGNGRYDYGTLAMPGSTFNSESYGADVVFDTSGGGGGTDGSVTGVTATATASATAPTVSGGAGVAGVTATATASGASPVVGGGASVTVAAAATSTARGWEPVVAASDTVVAVTATASASASAPVVIGGANVVGVAAASTALGQAPTVSGGFAADAAPPAATATATGLEPLVEAGALVLAVAATAVGTANVPGLASGAFAVPAATATATAWRPTLDPAPEGGTDSGMESEELQAAMQRLSGTTLDAQGAANVWAGTSGLELEAALNVKAGNLVPRGLLAVLNQLAGTANLDVAAAAARIPG